MSAKHALVLGGSGYVGSAVTRAFAQAGVSTAFSYFRSHQKAEQLVAELSPRASVQALPLDARDTPSIRRLFESMASDGLDIFVHCIALAQSKALAEITDMDWDELHAINVRSAFVACQEAAPLMAKRGGGSIVLTAALDGIKAVPSPAHFGATQGALVGMTRALSKELGPHNIRINLVVMGVLQDGLARDLSSKLREDYKRFSAMGRIGTAEEVAKVIVRIALHETYMTGATLMVDGGL